MPNFVGAHTNVYTASLASGNTTQLREGCLAFRVAPAAGASATVVFGLSFETVAGGSNLSVKTGSESITVATEFVSDPRTAGYGPVEITASSGAVVISCDYRADAGPLFAADSDPFAIKTGLTVDHDIGP